MSKPFQSDVIEAVASLADPSATADRVKVYSKIDSGVVQLFVRVSDGTVYQLTPVSAGGGIVNDPWGPRSTPHTADDEFIGPTIDASWAQTGFASALTLGTRPNPYATPIVNAASFENRREPDNTVNNSWLRIQPGASRAGLWKRIDTAAFGGAVPANLLAWARFSFSWRNETAPGAGDANIGLTFFSESGAGFSLASHATILLSASSSFGPAGTQQPLFVVRNDSTGTETVITYGSRQNAAATNRADYAFYSGYVALQKIGNNYYAWIIDDGGRLFMGEALPVGGGGDGPDNVNSVALWCEVAGGGTPGIMIYDMDFVRFYQGADWIP